MRFKLALVLCFSSSISLSGCNRPAGNIRLTNPSTSSTVEVDLRTACVVERDVLKNLQNLISARSQRDAQQARKVFFNESEKSPRCRKEQIAVIMRAMDKPNVDFTRDPYMYGIWREGAKLLGDMKATEALDLLISHLGLSSGLFSTSMSQQPALDGVIKMGPVAIPKLRAVLEQSPNPDTRRYAVYCIAGIGGASADYALKQSLASESDPCIKRFIQVSIDTIDVKSGGLKPDTVTWFRAFQCLG